MDQFQFRRDTECQPSQGKEPISNPLDAAYLDSHKGPKISLTISSSASSEKMRCCARQIVLPGPASEEGQKAVFTESQADHLSGAQDGAGKPAQAGQPGMTDSTAWKLTSAIGELRSLEVEVELFFSSSGSSYGGGNPNLPPGARQEPLGTRLASHSQTDLLPRGTARGQSSNSRTADSFPARTDGDPLGPELESHDDIDFFPGAMPDRKNPDRSDKFSGYLSELTRMAFEKILQRSHSSSKRAAHRSSESTPLAKRQRRSFDTRQDPASPLHVASEDVNDNDSGATGVTESKEYEYHGFACPFFIHQPQKFKHCLSFNLYTVKDVQKHLWSAHCRPFHCPICYRTFDTASMADSHIRSRTCEINMTTTIEGIPEDQLNGLTQPLDPVQSEEEQWLTLWALVFPGVEKPPNDKLYPRTDAILAVNLMKYFWAREGRALITSFLQSREQGHIRPLHGDGSDYRGRDKDAWERERAVNDLHEAVLGQMVSQLLVSPAERRVDPAADC